MAFASRTLDRVTGMNSKAGASPGFFIRSSSAFL
jgi:hypothetical protein